MSSFRVLRNVSASYFTYGVNLVIAVLLTPVLFHQLGKRDFAVFVLVQAVYALLASLDLGLLVALVRFVSDARERREVAAVHEITSTVFFVLGGFGILISAGIALAGSRAAWLAGLPAEDAGFAAKALVITSLGLGLDLAGLALAAYLQANHEFHLQNSTETAVRVLRAAAMAALALSGYGLLAVVAVVPIASGLRVLGNLLMVRFGSQPFLPDIRAVRLACLRQLGRFGLLGFVDVNVYHAFLQADVLLAARVLALPQLALIGAVRPFTGALPQISRQAMTVAYPMVVAVEAREQTEARGRFVTASSRNWTLLSSTFAVILLVWAPVLLELWLGAEMGSGATVLRLLLLAGLVASFSYIPGTLLYALDRVGYCATVALASAVAGIAGAAWAGQRFGAAGLAAALLGAQFLCTALLYVGAFHWGKIPPGRVFEGALAPCLLPLAGAVTVSVGTFLILPHGWGGMIVSALLASGISMALFLAQMKSPDRSWRATIDAIILRD